MIKFCLCEMPAAARCLQVLKLTASGRHTDFFATSLSQFDFAYFESKVRPSDARNQFQYLSKEAEHMDASYSFCRRVSAWYLY